MNALPLRLSPRSTSSTKLPWACATLIAVLSMGCNSDSGDSGQSTGKGSITSMKPDGGSARPRAPEEQDAGAAEQPAQGEADAGVEPLLRCGGKICNPESSRLLPCCLPDGVCGLGLPTAVKGEVYWCIEAEQAGEVDPACPSVFVQNGVAELKGCCRPDHLCGALSWINLGCIERTALDEPEIGELEAISCGETDTDAGL